MANKTSVLIVGSTGFLGSSLVNGLDAEVVTADRSIWDLSKPITNSFQELIKNKQFNYVIISAAITDVEKCFQDKVLSQQVNVNSVKELLDAVKKTRTVPVFFSSDYVFSGQALPYKEIDPRIPQTIYGHQKLAIENYLEENFKNYLIFRTSKLMSKTLHSKNILLPVLQSLSLDRAIKCFQDQLLNPVFVEDISEVLDRAFSSSLSGTFHLGTRRIFSRFEFGVFLASAFGFNVNLVEPIKMDSIQFSEKRPFNNSLNCTKIEDALDFGFCELEDAFYDLKKVFSGLQRR